MLSKKTCLEFSPHNPHTNSSLIRFEVGGNSTTSTSGAIPPSVLTVKISSWESITYDLVNSLCIFYEGAQPHPRNLVTFTESEARIDCLSDSFLRESKVGYISILDSEKINALYNCGGTNFHFVFQQ